MLYELVAPPGTRIPKGATSSRHPVGALQTALKNVLGLEHQLEYVDYQKENLLHADMSPDQFSKSMQDRGESFWTILFRMMGEGISKQAKYQAQGKSFDAELLLALFDNNRAVRLKRVLAEQFEDLEGAMARSTAPKVRPSSPSGTKLPSKGSPPNWRPARNELPCFTAPVTCPTWPSGWPTISSSNAPASVG